MKPDVETFDSPAAFAAAVRAATKGRARKGTATAQSEPGQGDRLAALTRLAAFGLMPRWRAGVGFDFWAVDGRTTTAHADYAAAVDAAESEATS